jgi:RND superfamily putative drug exporter
MTIIPAVMAMLGARAWWLPGWLDRLIPNVDLEGAGLKRPQPKPPPSTGPAVGAEAG